MDASVFEIYMQTLLSVDFVVDKYTLQLLYHIMDIFHELNGYYADLLPEIFQKSEQSHTNYSICLDLFLRYIDIDDSYVLDTFHDLDDYYNEWMEDLIVLMIVYLHYNDRYYILDDVDRSSTLDDLRDWLRIVDGNGKVNNSIILEDKLKSNYQGTMYKDECYLIITNES